MRQDPVPAQPIMHSLCSDCSRQRDSTRTEAWLRAYPVSGQARTAALCSGLVGDSHVVSNQGRSRQSVDVEVEVEGEETKLPQELGRPLLLQDPWEKHGYECVSLCRHNFSQ